MLLYSKTGDVWEPKLSSDGRFVACGGAGQHDAPPRVCVVHLASGQEIPLGRGRAIHWIGPSTVTWVVNLDNLRSERWHAQIIDQDGSIFALNVSKTPDDPAIVAGNKFAASNGHWASWLDEGKRVVYDGRVLSTRASGLAMAGEYLVYVEDGTHFVRVWNGTFSVRFPLPERANSFTMAANGIIGYGYYWPARIINLQGVDIDVTATPWRQESVPWIVDAEIDGIWAWTATVSPSDNDGMVLGRPLGSLNCIIIDHFPAVSLDVVIAGRTFIIAGSDDTGHLQVHRYGFDHPRALVAGGPVVVPDPDPSTPEPPKDTPVKLDPDYVATIFEFTAKFPCPGWDEDVLRGEDYDGWTPRLIQQLTFAHPSAGFGWKARDRNAPPSSDVICIRKGGRTIGWDIIPGAGTPGWSLNPAAAESFPLDDQYFFELSPRDWVGSTPEEPEEPEEPGEPGPGPTPPTDLAPIIREFDETQNALSQLVMAMTMVSDACNRVGDVMERIERHDLVIANEIRIATAAVNELRKRLDSSIKVRL